MNWLGSLLLTMALSGCHDWASLEDGAVGPDVVTVMDAGRDQGTPIVDVPPMVDVPPAMCGMPNMACCTTGVACMGRYACDNSDRCKPCGRRDQPCCTEGDMCDPNLSCETGNPRCR